MKKRTHQEYEQLLFNKEIDYYPMENYITHHSPILHECLKGHQWKITPGHILAGIGCPSCSGNKKKTNDDYVACIIDRDLINLESYKGDGIKILHECLICLHKWSTAPSGILQGTGCPVCNVGTFKINKRGILYHVSIDYFDTIIYKVGITNNSVRDRFRRDWNRLNMKLIWEISFDIGLDARILEQKLLKNNERILNIKPLRGGGNTELLKHLIVCPVK